jgi:hypothetical protein
MAAPSKSYTLIADSSIDSNSIIDATLMTQIRDNLIHLEEWLGNGYTAAQDHDHDGVNSKSPVLANGSVTGAKMSKTIVTSGSQAINATSSWTPAAVIGNFIGDGTYINLELYIGGSWRSAGAPFRGGLLMCDNANVRLYNTDSSQRTAWYMTF